MRVKIGEHEVWPYYLITHKDLGAYADWVEEIDKEEYERFCEAEKIVFDFQWKIKNIIHGGTSNKLEECWWIKERNK